MTKERIGSGHRCTEDAKSPVEFELMHSGCKQKRKGIHGKTSALFDRVATHKTISKM
jgi:hypothetical protein